ncbi:MAG: phosphate uptake regulator PhoU [Archaeoglobaceae archaeon]|nr:phosphate uptake regulator PhoU [Archaeoglobaceae archaeon]MCX8152771.1 phosphate uptake regulator PhoU [Archaeoglobaceae archaeon]MDW8013478.1 phosphate uptake regulator PhoU [Archaeoglobaceae archaeon]
MEVRKLQLIGGSSFMVSLPKSWIKNNELGQGDEVFLKVENNIITIYPKKFFEISKIASVKINKLPRYDEKFLRRYIYALYIQGIDEITVEDENINARLISKIGEIVKDLIGMEIIDASEGFIRLKCLAVTDFDVYSVVKRMTQIIKSMLQTIKYLTLDPSSIRDIELLERDADRLYLLAVRQEHRLVREFSSPAKWNELRLILGIRTVAKLLEEIADSLYDFSNYLLKAMNPKEFINYLNDIENSFERVCEAYFNSQVDLAEDSIEILEEIEGKLIKVEGDPYFKLSVESLIIACRHMKSICEIALNKAVRESIYK